MDSRGKVAGGRRTAGSRFQRFLSCSTLALLALLCALAPGQSQAQALPCSIVPLTATDQTGPAGTPLLFGFQAQGGCAALVNVVATINPPDNTGGATVAPAGNFDVAPVTPTDITLTLGPNPGQTGTVTVSCPTGGCNNSIVYTFRTSNEFVYDNATLSSVVTNQIRDFSVATSLFLNGAPATLASNFTNITNASAYGPRPANASGVSTLTESIPIAGNYVVRANIVCPTAFVLPGCAAVPPVDFNVLVEPVSLDPVTPLATTAFAGISQTLTVSYGSASFNGPTGTPISWVLASQPAGGDATLNGANLLGGESDAVFSATVPGVYTVQASVACAVCAVNTRTFNITVSAAPPPLNLVTASANPAPGAAGVPQVFSVQLDLAGAPVPAESIQWTAGAPFSPASATSVTDGSGIATASFTPSAAGNYPAAITATFDPDGVPASGDELSVSFDAAIAAAPGLAIAGGDGQQAAPGNAFELPLVVLADNSGTPAAGVGITWAVAGDAVLVPGGPTNASGQASATVTAGAGTGPVTVTATRQDAATASVSFSLTVAAPGSLQPVSGDGQSLQAGQPSAPLVVRLLDGAGNPVAGATVNWTTDNGTLEASSTTTDGSGETSTRLTLETSGEAEVTATSPLATAPAVFRLRGALASLAGLDPTQEQVAAAVDNFCPALAGLPSRTPDQEDLYQRCQDLARAAALDPAATVLALDQLMADVALAQANAAFAAAHSQFQNLRARIAALRSGTQGTDFGGLALTTPQGLFSLGLLTQALGDEDPVPMEVGADFSRWGFFASGTLGRGEVDPGQVDPAYDTDIEGISAGVDYRFSDRLILGGALGLTRQDTTLPGGRGEVETSGWSVSGYTTFYQPDSWYVDGVLTWGRNDYDLLRTIRYTLPLPGGGTQEIDQRAVSSSEGDLLSMAFTFGRDFNRGAWGLGPYGRLLFTRIDFEVIEESLQPGPGSGLGLRIEQRELESLASVLGGKLTYTHSTNWGVLMPHLQLEWEHEFRDDPQALEARFLNDPTGSVMLLRGDELDTDYFRIGLGMSMVLTKGRSGYFYYERLMGKDRNSQYNLALGFRMEF